MAHRSTVLYLPLAPPSRPGPFLSPMHSYSFCSDPLLQLTVQAHNRHRQPFLAGVPPPAIVTVTSTHAIALPAATSCSNYYPLPAAYCILSPSCYFFLPRPPFSCFLIFSLLPCLLSTTHPRSNSRRCPFKNA